MIQIRSNAIDITGKMFSDLTVIKKVARAASRGVFWECVCACGNKCIAYGGHLRAGKRKSCGCRSQRRIEETGINNLYNLYKKRSLNKGREFKLTKCEFGNLIKLNCKYCNSQPSQILKRQKTKKTQIYYNGIDRIDSNIGYILSNCVTSCMHCNRSKSNFSLDEWKNHIRKVHSWLLTDF